MRLRVPVQRWSSATSLAFAAFAVGACNWISLARNAITYQTVQRGEAGNLAALDSLLYVTLAEDGWAIVDARSAGTRATVAPPPGTGSVDDIAITGGLLFALDARAPGQLSVYSLADPLHPVLVSPPREVPVGPFSGVSANGGICIVSGGTSELTVWRYDSVGTLSGPVATGDFGRGQPDVLVATDGRTIYVSTHYRGPYFGLDILRYDPGAGRLQLLAEIALDGAGFTAGGAKPANFPIEVATLATDTVLVAHGNGVTVISIAAAARPQAVATIDVGGPAVNVDALGASALVAVSGSQPALVVLDLAVTGPRVSKRIPLPPGTQPGGVVFTPAHAAVAARGRGVLIFDR